VNKTNHPVVFQSVNTLPVVAVNKHKLLCYKVFEHALSIKRQQRSTLRMTDNDRFLVTF